MSYRVTVTSDGSKYEENEILHIFHDDEEIAHYRDGGEPEDNLYCRDWNWVSFALEEAYRFGQEDTQRDWRNAQKSEVKRGNH
jgi:hypothetical protein